eukprot:gene5903-8143_t
MLSSFVFLLASCSVFSQKLEKYSISDVTVSGLSSGAYMAVQMHIAYSAIVNGSAIFAGGPFYCAEGNLIYAEEKCMDIAMGKPNTNQLISLTYTDASIGKIDNPKNLIDDKVFIFSGDGDTVVKTPVVQALRDYYLAFVDAGNLVTDFNTPAEHCMPTLDYGEQCTTLKSPYIGKCNYDGAKMAFTTLFGDDLNPRTTAISSNLKVFTQTSYIPTSKSSLGSEGYIYVPTSCAAGAKCRLHISFHGCQQTLDQIGNAYAAHSGYNEWAESNNIIVLYPYAVVSTFPSNPNGCWDWWAYTGTDYGVQSGVQMKFVRNLIAAVSGI